MLKLWFIKTELGWTEIFYQLDKPVFSAAQGRWVGRSISHLSPRDTRALRLNGKYNTFLIGYQDQDAHTEYYLKICNRRKIKFMRRRKLLWDIEINPYCHRLIKLLNLGHLPDETIVSLYPTVY